MTTLFQKLLVIYPLKPDEEIVSSQVLPPPMATFKFISSPSLASKREISIKQPKYSMAVIRNQRITEPEWFQDVRHLELESEEDIE